MLGTNHSTSRELNLSYHNLTVEDFQAFSEALKINTSLETLRINKDHIDDRAARYLAEGLKLNKGLKTLCLRNNSQLGDIGAVELADALQVNTTLQAINLEWNHIELKGIRALTLALQQNSSLQSLAFGGTKVRAAGAAYFAELLRNNRTLRYLSLKNSELGAKGTKQIVAALYENTTLYGLNLRGNKLGVSGTEALAQLLSVNKSLKNLALRFPYQEGQHANGISKIAHALEKNRSLEHLSLDFSELGLLASFSALCRALLHNNVLNSLNIGWNSLSNRDIGVLSVVLKGNDTLQHLDLSGNRFGDEGASILGEAIKENQSLLSIQLEACEIGDIGMISLADALETNKTIRSINLARSLSTGTQTVTFSFIAPGAPQEIMTETIEGKGITDIGITRLITAIEKNKMITWISFDSKFYPSYTSIITPALLENIKNKLVANRNSLFSLVNIIIEEGINIIAKLSAEDKFIVLAHLYNEEKWYRERITKEQDDLLFTKMQRAHVHSLFKHLPLPITLAISSMLSYKSLFDTYRKACYEEQETQEAQPSSIVTEMVISSESSKRKRDQEIDRVVGKKQRPDIRDYFPS